ncbi:MAG TPA: hypothetical protein VH637_20010 [Streptosporangiaceae bacterium]
MPNHTDNPAGRLYALLVQLRGATDSFYTALCKAYKVAPGDAVRAAPFICRAVQLPDKCAAQVRTLDESLYDEKLILRWHEPVRKLMAEFAFRNDTAAGSNTTNRIKEAELLSLQFCSDLLHRHLPERVLAEEEFGRISGLIEELKTELAEDAAIDSEFRAFLLGHVAEMEDAIAVYPVDGSTALIDALDKTVGSLNRRSDIVTKADKSPSAWTKFGNLIVVVAAVCQITGSQLALPAMIKHELSSSHPSTTPQVVIDSHAGTTSRQAQPDKR